jgi:hypothetical protein
MPDGSGFVSRTLLNWGTFFIVLGAIPLAVQAGLLDIAATQQLLRFWPLILIALGIGFLLRVTPLAALGGVIVAATAGMLLGAVLASGVSGVGGFGSACVGTGTGGEVATQDGAFAGGRASIDMELTCVSLSVQRTAGSSWSVEAGHAPDRRPTIEPAADRLTLASDSGRAFMPFGDDVRRDWRVSLPQETSLSTSITLNAGSADIGLGGGPLDALSGTFNAADARVDAATATALRTLSMTWNAASGRLALPPISMSGNMTLNASSVTVCVPPDVGVRISHQATLSSDNFDELGMTRSGDAWQTADYASAAEQIDLRVSSNVSSIELSRAGGCE